MSKPRKQKLPLSSSDEDLSHSNEESSSSEEELPPPVEKKKSRKKDESSKRSKSKTPPPSVEVKPDTPNTSEWVAVEVEEAKPAVAAETEEEEAAVAAETEEEEAAVAAEQKEVAATDGEQIEDVESTASEQEEPIELTEEEESPAVVEKVGTPKEYSSEESSAEEEESKASSSSSSSEEEDEGKASSSSSSSSSEEEEDGKAASSSSSSSSSSGSDEEEETVPVKVDSTSSSGSSGSGSDDDDEEEEDNSEESSSSSEEEEPAKPKGKPVVVVASSSSSSEEEEESGSHGSSSDEEESSKHSSSSSSSEEEERVVQKPSRRKSSSPSVEPLSSTPYQQVFQRKANKSRKLQQQQQHESDSESSSSSHSSSSNSSHSSSSSSSSDGHSSDSSNSSDDEDVVASKSRFAQVKLRMGALLKRARAVKFNPMVLRDDYYELKRAAKLGGLAKQVSQQPKTRAAFARVVFASFVLLLLLLLSFAPLSFGTMRKVQVKEDYPPNWRRGRHLSLTELMDLIPVYDNSLQNDSSVPLKRMPTLDKPQYLSASAKDLVQIKRPAVRKKRPDEPRAVRTFGCLRDGCRGLEIEDLLDRGWQMRFRAAQKNDTYKSINYRVTFLLTDTTQLNHMRMVRPDLYDAIYNSYERKSYLIAFDGADAIGGNKGQQLKVKERFVRKYGCKFSELAISPASFRLYLHEECEDLINLSAKATWLLKPEAGSQGQGITFHTEVADIMNKQPKFFPCKKDVEYKATERFLVQEYIEKPLLLKKCKFDARVYMNVASSSPFLVFYHEGYLRRALAPYTALSRDRRVYLTNTHFQSMKKDFKLSEHIWSFPEFGAYLKEQGRTGGHYIESILNPQIKKIALFIFMSARQKLKKRKGTFHIMGLDFMVDEDFHVWFIEANGFPGFTWSINFDTRTMVEEWFNLAQQVHENPRFYQLMREGDRYGGFEMIFSELEEEQTQMMYNPCQEFKYNRGYTQPLKEANKLFAQISGKGGKTEKFKHYSSTWKTGGTYLGGPLSDQMLAREEYFAKYSCKKNAVHFSLPEFALFKQQSCQQFFSEYGQSGYGWVVKPIKGSVEEFRVYSSIEAMRAEFETCQERPPDFIVQKLVPNRPLVLYKWWDIKVYMLVASTKPYFVFYHQGFARTSKLSYVEGGESTSTAQNKDDENDAEDEAVELDEDEGGVEDNSPGEPAAAAAQQQPLPQVGEDGVEVPVNPYLILPPSEPWAPKAITTGAQFTLGEEFMTLEKLEDEMARADMVGSRWMSSVFDTYAKRTAALLFQAAKFKDSSRANQTYQLVQMNFLLDHKLQIHFVSSKNVDADSFPNAEVLQEQKANFLQTMAGLVLELHTMPLAFSRLRRGDSYGGWRLVFSEIEEKQRGLAKTYNPCDEFKPNLQISKSSLFKDAWLHQHTLKSHARNKRELRKYVERKWASSCAHKPTPELRASCIRNTISYRYKQYIEKERIPYQDGYVENHIRELQNRASQPKSSQGGGL